MLRHWSAGSGPAGRLFCKSNRSTRRALSGGPLSFSLILLSLPYLSLFCSFLPLLHPFLPCPLQRRCSSGAAAILFLKNDQQACTFVRSRRNPGSRLLSLSLSLFLFVVSLFVLLLLPFSLSPTFGRVAAPRMVAPWPTAILTAMRLERKRNWTTRMERARSAIWNSSGRGKSR